jgi:thiol-disulfide isomerase/thioredoxin
MFSRLLFFASLFGSCHVMAQRGDITQPAAQEIDYKLIGAPMPRLRYILCHDTATKKSADGNAVHSDAGNATVQKPILTNEDLDNGANLFVMMFNPTCSHCMDETILLEKNGELFKRSKIALLANPVMKAYVGDFVKNTHIDQYPSFMYLGIDSADFINKVFLYRPLPQINIYDKNRKLIKIFTGEVVIDSLSKYIQ